MLGPRKKENLSTKTIFSSCMDWGCGRGGGGGGVDVVDVRNQQAMQHNDRKNFRVIFYCLFLSIVY